MATSTRWGGFRPDPYNPNAVDGDNDGIVQEGTLFERPAGARFVNLDGSELRDMLRGDNLTVLNGLRLVGEDGKPVEYRQSWRSGQISLGQSIGTIDSRGLQTVGQLVGEVEPRRAPGRAAPKPNMRDIAIPSKYGGSKGLSELRSNFPELFDSDGNLKKPSRPIFYEHGLQGAANDLMEGVSSWAEAKERLRGKTIIAYDYETTDFVDNGGRGVQIGAVKIVDGEIVDRFNVYMNPGMTMDEWSPFSRDNLKFSDGSLLTPERVAGFPSSREAHARFMDWIGADEEFYMMGHNALAFDDILLEREYELAGIDRPRPAGRIDTLSLSRDINADSSISQRNTLTALTDALGIDLGDKAHTADADSEATGSLLFKLLDHAEERDLPIDLINPNSAMNRERERRERYDADMDRYREASSIYKEIEAETQRRDQERRTAATRERGTVEAVREDAPVEGIDAEEDQVDLEEISVLVDDVAVRLDSLIEDVDFILTDDETVEPRRLSDTAEVEMLLTADGKVPELDSESARTLDNIRKIGRSLRLEALKQFRRDPDVRTRQRQIDELNSEIADRENKLNAAMDPPKREYLNNVSLKMFDKVMDVLNEEEMDKLYEALETDRDFDTLTRRLESDNMDRLRALDENKKLQKLLMHEQRKAQAKYIRQLLSGDSTDSRGRRYTEPDSTLPTISTRVSVQKKRGGKFKKAETDKAVKDAVVEAERHLPPELRRILSDSVENYGMRIEVVSPKAGMGHLGHYLYTSENAITGSDDDAAMVIAIQEDLIDSPEMLQQIVYHELLHATQDSSPEMFILEQMFGQSRNAGNGTDSFEIEGGERVTIPDDFSDSYSGRIYANSEGAGGYYEITTNSLDKVLFPTTNDPLEHVPDDDQIDFALGVLLGVRQSTSTNRETFITSSTVRAGTGGRLDPKASIREVPERDTPSDELDEIVDTADYFPVESPDTFPSVAGDPYVGGTRDRIDTPQRATISSEERATTFASDSAEFILDAEGYETVDLETGTGPFGDYGILSGFRDRENLYKRRKQINKRGKEEVSKLSKLGSKYKDSYQEAYDGAPELSGVTEEEIKIAGKRYSEAVAGLNQASTELRQKSIIDALDDGFMPIIDSSFNEEQGNEIRNQIYYALDDLGFISFSRNSQSKKWRRPLPVDSTPETIKESIDERVSKVRELILQNLKEERITKKINFNESQLAELDKMLQSIGESTFRADVRTFILGEGPEFSALTALRESLELDDGKRVAYASRIARRRASSDFMKSLSPRFGTGSVDMSRVDTSELRGVLTEDEIDELFTEVASVVPKYWIDYINDKGYKFIITDRGYHDINKKVIAISNRNQILSEVARNTTENFVGVMVHEIAHGVSTANHNNYTDGVFTGVTSNKIKHNTALADLVLHTLAPNSTATTIYSTSPDELSFLSSDPDPEDYDYAYLLKTYAGEGVTPNEVLPMLSEALLLGDKERLERIQRNAGENFDMLLGFLLSTIIEE